MVNKIYNVCVDCNKKKYPDSTKYCSDCRRKRLIKLDSDNKQKTTLNNFFR